MSEANSIEAVVGLNPTQSKDREPAPSYKEILDTIKKYGESAPEAQEILYGERPARSDEERLLGTLDLEIAGLEAEAEKLAELNDYKGEKLVQKTIAFKKAMAEFFKIYFDFLAVDENGLLVEAVYEDFKNALTTYEEKKDTELGTTPKSEGPFVV